MQDLKGDGFRLWYMSLPWQQWRALYQDLVICIVSSGLLCENCMHC